MLKKMMWTNLTILMAGAGTTMAGGAPVNDHCADAIAITAADTPLAFNNTGADTETTAPSAMIILGADLANTIWYSYTPAVTGLAQIDFCGTDPEVIYFDAAFFESCGGDEAADVFGDFLSPCQDQVGGMIPITANVPIKLMIGSLGDAGLGGYEGSGFLNITEIGVPDNDFCANPKTIGQGTEEFNTILATAEIPLETCSFRTGVDLWYSYTASSHGTLFIEGTYNYPTTKIQFSTYDTCGGPVQACFETIGLGQQISIEPGQSFLIRIATYNRTSPEGIDEHGPNSFTLTEIAPPANDTCSASVPAVAAGVNIQYDTYGGRNDGTPTCDDHEPFDIYYKFTASRSGSHTFTGTGDDTPVGLYIPKISIYTTCGDAELACSSQVGLDTVLNYNLAAGQTVYIRVGTNVWSTGHFSITAPACGADFNQVNGVTVQDIFDFLTAWLAGSPTADFNHVNGVTVQDIFDFLTAWLAGC